MNGHYIEEDTDTSYSMAAEPPVDYK
jgi:hypothetical protein